MSTSNHPRQVRATAARAVGCLLLTAAAAGCGEARGGTAASAAPALSTVSAVSSGGVTVVFPQPLALHHPDLVEACLRLVDQTAPEPDARIAPEIRGVPPGVTVYVRQSGAFPVDGPAPGFALGSTDLRSRIWLALKRCSDPSHGDQPLLPALAHELRHVYTLDPSAGH